MGGQHRSLRQRQTRRKAGTQSHGPGSLLGDTAAGPPKAPEWVGDRSPVIDDGTAVVRPHLDGEIDMAGIKHDARKRLAAAPTCRTQTSRSGLSKDFVPDQWFSLA